MIDGFLIGSYGAITYGINWDSSVLWPQGVMGVLSTIGIVINAFGYMLLLFPLYVIISFTIHSQNTMKEAYKPKVGRYVDGSVLFLGSLFFITGIILFLMYRADPRIFVDAH